MLGHSLTKFRAPVYDFSGRTALNGPARFRLVSSQNLLKGNYQNIHESYMIHEHFDSYIDRYYDS
jgi:hypothetical protein